MITTMQAALSSSIRNAPARPISQRSAAQASAAETTSPIRAAFDRRIAKIASSMAITAQPRAIAMPTAAMLTMV